MFIFKGVSSEEMDLIVEKLPELSAPKQRSEEEQVPGRDGHVTFFDGSYEGITKSVDCHYVGDNSQALKKWLTGSGKVMFDNDPEVFYKATIVNKIPFNQIFRLGIYKIQIQFRCQPFGYLSDGEDTLLIVNGQMIYNPGVHSNPKLRIYGSGLCQVTVNSETFQITIDDEYVEIDSELFICSKGPVNKGRLMIGDFPVLEEGENTIKWVGNVTKLELTPRWRML